MSRLEQRIENAKKAGRYALIPFITAGFPTMERFRAALRELDDCGADIIEIGIPFSDPVADGPVVEEASRRVLEAGMNLRRVLEELQNSTFQAGIVLMGYYNPFLQYGLDKLAHICQQIGVEGIIVPDLPLEEAAPLRALLQARNIDLISLVSPNTSDERMREYNEVSRGYIYVVSVMGTTGVRGALAPAAAETLQRAQNNFNIPVALGFGLHEPAQVAKLEIKPDALVFGSALLQHLDSGAHAKDFMRPWLK